MERNRENVRRVIIQVYGNVGVTVIGSTEVPPKTAKMIVTNGLPTDLQVGERGASTVFRYLPQALHRVVWTPNDLQFEEVGEERHNLKKPPACKKPIMVTVILHHVLRFAFVDSTETP